MIRKQIRFSSVKNREKIKTWKDKMSGFPVFILGNGPSINDYQDLSILNNYFTIGINRIFYKIDPTILFWQDIELWLTERRRIIKSNSIKVCNSLADPQNRFYHFSLKSDPFRIPDNPATLYGKGNTGALAVEFATSLGCNKIILIGCDCKPRGKNTDFYGVNRHHKKHTMNMCSNGLKWIFSLNNNDNIEIINCSDNNFSERVDLYSFLDNLDKKYSKNKDYYNSMII